MQLLKAHVRTQKDALEHNLGEPVPTEHGGEAVWWMPLRSEDSGPGFTPGCPGCDVIRRKLKAAARHNDV